MCQFDIFGTFQPFHNLLLTDLVAGLTVMHFYFTRKFLDS